MFDLGLSIGDLVPFIIVGFAAQVIDGALGMAFGVISQTMLVSVLGMAPAAASASTHLVEIFTTGASGASHIVHRNVDWGLFSGWSPSAWWAASLAPTCSPTSMPRSPGPISCSI